MNATLARWRADIVAWAEECCLVKHPDTGRVEPLRLVPEQKAFMRDATMRDANENLVHTVAVFSTPKRCGKSLCVALVIAHRMTLYPDKH